MKINQTPFVFGENLKPGIYIIATYCQDSVKTSKIYISN